MVDVNFTIEDFQQVCAEIGLAGLDPSRWQNVLDKLRHMSGGVRTHFMGFDLQAGIGMPAFASGYDPDFFNSFGEYYSAINPWGDVFFSSPSLTTLTIEQMRPRRDILNTEFWSDWVRPQEDISCGAGSVLINTPHRKFFLGGNVRYKDQDKIEASWITLAKLVAPQIVNALEVSRMLSGLRLETFLHRQGLEPTETAVVIMDSARRPIWTNDLAQAWIEAGDPLCLGPSGKIAFRDPESGIAAATARFRQQGAGFTVRDKAGSPFAAQCVEIGENGLQMLPAPEALFAPVPLSVLLLRHQRETQDQAAFIASALGLTHSEAAVALLLSEGLSLSEIAEARQVQLVTVRNQVKSALSKTDCRRQANLLLRIRQCLGQGPYEGSPRRI